jgi:hypothetical protein
MDVYDREVERLTRNPDDIPFAWMECTPLFVLVGNGCLTQIRAFDYVKAYTPELTAAIRADDCLPRYVQNITPAHLPVFAEWQRKIDMEFNRTPPVMRETP